MFWLIVKLALENVLFFGLHFEGKNNFPKQLSSKEEERCLKIMTAPESTELEIKTARDKLIVHNLRLVAYIVNKKYPDFADADDLVSIGTIGLIRDAETFDLNKNNKFSTYASRCIDNAITQLRKNHFDLQILISPEEMISSFPSLYLTLSAQFSSVPSITAGVLICPSAPE